MVTPPSMSGRPSTSLCRSYPMPARPVRAGAARLAPSLGSTSRLRGSPNLRKAARLTRRACERDASARGFSRARDGFREHEIRAGRDLQIRRLAFDDAHGVTGPLGERRFIGGVNRLREGIAEDIAPERLRRLRQIDRLARDRLPDVSIRASDGPSAVRFTVSQAWTAATAAPLSAAAAIVRPMRSALANGRAAS